MDTNFNIKNPDEGEIASIKVDGNMPSAHRDDTEKYILETLQLTPKDSVENGQYVQIVAYAPGELQPSMKIFRMIKRMAPLKGAPEGVMEVAFQDEVDVLDLDGNPDLNIRWQVNFSIYANKDDVTFHSINQRPESIGEGLKLSLAVFERLSTQKGATLFAGDVKFESDGNVWILQRRSGDQPQLMTIVPPLPVLSEQAEI